MNTVFLDESGNTGPDLLNADQPVFVLSSVCLDSATCTAILEPLSHINADELYFTRLRKCSNFRSAVTELLSSDLVNGQTVKVYFLHKRFMVTCKYLDLLLEPMLHESGIDCLDGGMNLSHANMHYMVLPVFCVKEMTEVFLADFVARFGTKRTSLSSVSTAHSTHSPNVVGIRISPESSKYSDCQMLTSQKPFVRRQISH